MSATEWRGPSEDDAIQLAACAPRSIVFSDTTDPAYYRDHLNPIVSKVLPANAFQQTTERGMLVEESEADDGSLIQVAALDHPSRWLSLTSGRAPQPCDGTDCEGEQKDE